MTQKQILEQAKAYIAACGYQLTDGVAEEFYLNLQNRPFTVLLGRSDAPMTQTVRLLAGAIGATEENGQLACMQVKPDWMDFSDLFGYVRLTGRFEPGAIIHFVKAAQDDLEKPYFLCLENLLLDRAEYYLKDILQPIEARKEADFAPQPLLTEKYYGSDGEAAERYGTLYVPQNLYVVCTLNLDETSLPMNQKLLDRVFTLELTKEDLMETDVRKGVCPAVDNRFLQPAYRGLFQCAERGELLDSCFAQIEELNKMLMKGSAYVGYQLRNDMAVYVCNAVASGIMSREQAMDRQILQKMLTHVQGNMKSVGPVLEALAAYCAGRYPGSAAKIADMMAKGQKDEYTSCWL